MTILGQGKRPRTRQLMPFPDRFSRSNSNDSGCLSQLLQYRQIPNTILKTTTLLALHSIQSKQINPIKNINITVYSLLLEFPMKAAEQNVFTVIIFCIQFCRILNYKLLGTNDL
jgi:hypothetical protein